MPATLKESSPPELPARACLRRNSMPGGHEVHAMLLDAILAQRDLTANFQPIAEFSGGGIFGFEGLIRGPADTPLHEPLQLFKTAEVLGRLAELERACRHAVLESFAAQQLPGRLFLNVSPECLLHRDHHETETLELMQCLGLEPSRIVIELTEDARITDYALLRKAVRHYRAMGFEIAIDDLGDGFSSLRLWSELRPEFVKIDMHFVRDINHDPVKQQFVRSIQMISASMSSRVIAEGIETAAEFGTLRAAGLALAQGFLLARPSPVPPLRLPDELVAALETQDAASTIVDGAAGRSVTVRKLMKPTPFFTPEKTVDEVYGFLLRHEDLDVLPVVSQGAPLGIINRYRFMDLYARPYRRELHGNKPCTHFMDRQCLSVDQDLSLTQLSRQIVEGSQRHIADGFIVTAQGQYLGIGSTQDLIREITELKIQYARHANPLTLLSGNVPTNEHIEILLHGRKRFVACHFDLDFFKPFNDRYGFRRGDDIILLCARLLSEACDPALDFLGHIGGDDFVLLFQSEDWEQRCLRILARFDREAASLFDFDDLKAGGFAAQDRQRRPQFLPLTSLSVGAVIVFPETCRTHYEVSAAAGEAKKQAKSIPGSSLFVERRRFCRSSLLNPPPIEGEGTIALSPAGGRELERGLVVNPSN